GSSTDAWYTIDMGDWSLDPASSVLVTTGGIEVARPGLRVSTGNPHTVVALAETAELEAAELRDAPVLDPVPAQGANVEYIVMEPARSDVAGGEGALRMRVFERGGGETRSRGTGARAAATAARHWPRGTSPRQRRAEQSPLRWRVDVPGGQLRIEIDPNHEGTSGRVSLAGPAVLVASGTIS